MSGAAVNVMGVGPAVGRQPALFRVEVFTALEAAEPVWRELEAGRDAVMSPYQRFDWVSAYMATLGRAEGESPLIAVLRDATGRPRLLLPLAVARRGLVRVARGIGGRHANVHLPLFASREAALAAPAAVTQALRDLGRAHGLDVFVFANQPLRWDECPNPVAAGGRPAPSDAYGAQLGTDAEATIKRLFSGEARRKLRQKEKWLAAAHGPLDHRVATGGPEAEATVAAYLTQKAARFAQLGLADPFAEPAARAFLAEATRPDARVLECHALAARESGRIFATFIGVADARRFSGMLTSFDADPPVARCSPGDLLLHALVRHQIAQGRSAFDLGVGEARYKTNVCDDTIALVGRTLPVTVRGHLYALGAGGIAGAKRRIKRNRHLHQLAGRLRAARAGA
ncbi:GNAT family N-acetyltransferase [Methylobacterium oryzisoli]|uniref:GNAT family N-acetyltransferase n=1 Tax=Methylobacterium oryzisoli TaxID=3385502 RepID=UPI00389289B6